jgi:hypothetical protein
VLAAALFCASCTSYYSIQAPEPGWFRKACATAPAQRATIMLERFRASPPLDGTAFELFDSAAHVIRIRDNYQWNGSPVELINAVVLQSLQSAKPFSDSVKVLPEGSRGMFTMSGEVTKLRIVSIGKVPQRVYLSVHVRVVRAGSYQAVPVLEGTYHSVQEVPELCLKRVPEALELAVDSIVHTTIGNLCGLLAPLPVADSFLAASAGTCLRNCAFRFTAIGSSAGRETPASRKEAAGSRIDTSAGGIGIDIIDQDGDIREHVDLGNCRESGDTLWTAAAAGKHSGLSVTLLIAKRKEKRYLELRGLPGSAIELPLQPGSDTTLSAWLRQHAPAR